MITKDRAIQIIKIFLANNPSSFDDCQDIVMHFIEHLDIEGEELQDFLRKCGCRGNERIIELDTGITYRGLKVLLLGSAININAMKIKGEGFCKMLYECMKERASLLPGTPSWSEDDKNWSDYFKYKEIK